MNQILGNQNINYPSSSVPFSSIKKFKLIFWVSFSCIILFIIFYFFMQYNSWKQEKVSESFSNHFTLRNLYTNTNNYIAQRTVIEEENPFVIGLLKIDKINLMYPILSHTSEELLKISPCYLSGPMPNEIGNLCIAGHNFANQTHFGKLSSLTEGDIIQIYDLNSKEVNYKIYKITEVVANDTSCLNQNTNGSREVTLITCNTIKGTRIVVKAKENIL